MTEERYRIVTETPARFQEFERKVDNVSDTIAHINQLESKYPDDFSAWIAELPENLKSLYEEINVAQEKLMTNSITDDEREAKRTALYMKIAKDQKTSAELAELSQILKQKDLEKTRERHA